MLRRLLVGLVIGLVVGGLAAAAIVAGLHMTSFLGSGGAVLAYLFAAITGVLTGLVAGKPIWASGARIEAGLKAFFGALIAAGGMFALRQWAGGAPIDLGTALGPGTALPIGELPALSLPIIAAVLGGFFELDNTGTKEEESKEPAQKKRVDAGTNGKGKARVEEGEEDVASEPQPPAKRAQK
jgi:hypothetical protein